jgi:flavin-dependent dehydrogenase
MSPYDVAIIGAGLAGLRCAKLLADEGATVLLVDRKCDLAKGIHTTGIFVRKTFEDFRFPALTLGKPIRKVTLYSPRLKTLDLESENDEFRVGKMGELYKAMLSECIVSGVEFLPGTRYVSAAPQDDSTVVRLDRQGNAFDIAVKVLVGADGAVSKVARDLCLDENREWIVGYEEMFRSMSHDGEPRLHCFLDTELAPGYIAWVADDGEEMHVGVGGYAVDFDPRNALQEFKRKTAVLFELENNVPFETRGGRIPVGGVLVRIANKHGLLIGDAAGAVSPLTAGGLDPCVRLSSFAAAVIAERLRSGDPDVLLKYSGAQFRARFISRLWMRRILAYCRNQMLVDLGFMLLKSSLGTRFARHVFFGRGSFPDVSAGTSLRGRHSAGTGSLS